MDELDRQESTFLEDEEVHITDLDAPGSSRQQRAARAIEQLRQGLKVPWIRYGFSGVLLAILLGAIILQWPRPAPVPASAAKTPISSFYTGAIAQGTIFIQHYDHSLTAYQLTTGHQQWHTTLPALASLNAEGQFLYCVFAEGSEHTILEALDMRSGKVVWHDNLLAVFNISGSPQFPTSRSFALEPTFIYQDNILYIQDIHDQILAIQGNNGKVRWTHQTSVHLQDSSSNTLLWRGIVGIRGGVISFTSVDNRVHVLNISTGQEILSFPPTSSATLPAIDGQTLYTLPPPGASTIQAFHLPDGQLLWNKPLPKGYWAQNEADGTVYLGAAQGSTLIAMRGSDGQALWSYHASDNQPVTGRFLAANGFGYLLQQDATLVCLRLSDGHILWQRQIKEIKNRISPTMDLIQEQGILLLYDINIGPLTPFYAFSSNDGHKVWQLKEVFSLPFFQAGSFYTIENRGQVDAWRIADGKHLWSFSAPAGTTIIRPTRNPSDLLFLLSLSNTLFVVRITDGRMLWRYP